MPGDTLNALRLLVDSVLVLSPGGDLLQVELAAALARTRPAGAELTVLCRRDQPRLHHLPGVSTIADGRRFVALSEKWRWLMWELPRHVQRLGANVTFEANGLVSTRLCRHCGVIGTTNDMLAFAPELLTPVPRLSLAAIQRRLRRAGIVRGLKRADAVILHSEYALRTLSDHAGDISEKTTVVHTGVPGDARIDRDDPPPHPHGGRPYLLYLSVIRTPKNHRRLIEAYRKLQDRSPEVPELLLAGISREDSCLDAITAEITAAGLGDRVRYVGNLDRSEVPAWLHHATVNVFPSLAETNSVIVTEILGMHGVLLASDIPPIREVAGDAAEYFDAHDPDAIASALGALWNNRERHRQLRAAAAERAATLSWDACGRAIWASAERVHRRRSAPA